MTEVWSSLFRGEGKIVSGLQDARHRGSHGYHSENGSRWPFAYWKMTITAPIPAPALFLYLAPRTLAATSFTFRQRPEIRKPFFRNQSKRKDKIETSSSKWSHPVKLKSCQALVIHVLRASNHLFSPLFLTISWQSSITRQLRKASNKKCKDCNKHTGQSNWEERIYSRIVNLK